MPDIDNETTENSLVVPEEKIYIDCPKCGRKHVEAHLNNSHLCVDCVKAEQNRVCYNYRHQGDWMSEAKAQGLDLWVRQPNESQWEYSVWSIYRDSYPGKAPSYRDVAEQLLTTHDVVAKIAQRWSFPSRLQAWIAHVDDLSQQQRSEAIIQMSTKHISLAQKLNEKLETAINSIDPLSLKPGEIATLAKTAAELERKALLDKAANEESINAQHAVGIDSSLKRKKTNVNDLSEVIGILAKAGALDTLKLKQTVTTEVSVDNAIDTPSTVVEGDCDE